MEVKLIDHMGTDLSVVNAARVSFSTISELDENGALNERDQKLINYLSRNNHWTPFAHTSITLHISAPIFVARQLMKHQVGGVVNEVSRRYVSTEPALYTPDLWRMKHENKKQGSHENKYITEIFDDDINTTTPIGHVINKHNAACLDLYNTLIASHVCPEQARMVLPQSMYVEYYWTGSLVFFSRVCNLRLKPDAQVETRFIADLISDIIEPYYPYSWKALIK